MGNALTQISTICGLASRVSLAYSTWILELESHADSLFRFFLLLKLSILLHSTHVSPCFPVAIISVPLQYSSMLIWNDFIELLGKENCPLSALYKVRIRTPLALVPK